MQRKHPLRPFYDIIDGGDVKQKIDLLPEFPRIIEFEITNHCNFQCLMCKTGIHTSTRPRGYMEDEIYQKLLDEIAGKGAAIKFVGQGEPLMHPHAAEFIKKAAGRGIVCHLTTNASFLTPEMMDMLLDSGLASLKFSFQGIDRVGYLEMRQKDYFDALYEKIKLFHKKRGDQEYPYITVCTSITDETPAQIEQFKETFANYCDKVEVGYTTLEFIEPEKIKNTETRKKLEEIKQKQMMNKVRYPCCNQIFDTLAVHWNGNITACCADNDDQMVLGKIQENSLAYCWSCEQEQQYRKILADKRYADLPLCQHCYDFMGYMQNSL